MTALTDVSVHDLMADIGRRARMAARRLAGASGKQKAAALVAMAAEVRARRDDILKANAIDVAAMKENGAAASFLDRGTLDPGRVEAIAKALEEIAALPDPVGRVLASWTRPNGLAIERVATPLGVIGIIFESRPNVTADAGALSLMAGNAAILRCGSDSLGSSQAILAALAAGLRTAGLPEDAIQLVPVKDRAAVGEMLTGLDGSIDVIVPRGGKSLVARVQAEARVPVFAHLEGICHVYVDKAADLDMAVNVTVNAKLRRVGVCGSAETLLVDRAVADSHLLPILKALHERGCEIRATDEVRARFPAAVPATEADWSTEYLAPIISVALVDGVDAAIEHIETYGSHHTDSILTADEATAAHFLAGVDSAIVLHNASTQFADGGEFGMGAEIGIATGKMHARGPVGVEQLTSFKYRVRGTGQTRP
ncbi:glutamate-5-semialdehyde dehydrogenase [Pleomorphomonas sp. NRK KF1]|uniref:glutamate-5-semialdehyde dehydrogenase n=1 Tax=Pleomorphomonas sp. NRK KF1 TaxID=2943000 RepID=UPI0020442C7D|nr:glutamate-5-semialdehyde dehydrogenase [Pleomorphomonas sp. NRK KF1]MCM5554780.1 glutamate-5-semialdehyde dehydrogenase [Pleomorphomonas sp. NRK KF1]